MYRHVTSFKFSASLCNAFCNGSKAGEPALDEWISRAEKCDKLHEPVGLKIDSQIQNLIFFLFVVRSLSLCVN